MDPTDPLLNQVITDVCANSGALLKFAAYAGGTISAASLLANFRKLLPAPIASMLDLVALNLVKAAAQTADQAKKAASALAIVVGLSLALSACAGSPQAPATQGNGAPVATAPAINSAQALYYLQSAGCVGELLAGVAAPVVLLEADAKGAQVLSALNQSGHNLCQVTVPASALPAPLPAGSPGAVVPVPAPAPAPAPTK